MPDREPELMMTGVGAKRKIPLQSVEETVGLVGIHYKVDRL